MKRNEKRKEEPHQASDFGVEAPRHDRDVALLDQRKVDIDVHAFVADNQGQGIGPFVGRDFHIVLPTLVHDPEPGSFANRLGRQEFDFRNTAVPVEFAADISHQIERRRRRTFNAHHVFY